jgi:NTP pyrophosphatase (non-canonical NTP hydrolase)
MNANDYQMAARKTAIYHSNPNAQLYPYLGLAGETGEVCEKVKKIIRDKNGKFGPDDVAAIKKELSDVCWYVANIAADLNLTLEEVFQCNIDKLKDRQERGVLQGSGDNR